MTYVCNTYNNNNNVFYFPSDKHYRIKKRTKQVENCTAWVSFFLQHYNSLAEIIHIGGYFLKYLFNSPVRQLIGLFSNLLVLAKTGQNFGFGCLVTLLFSLILNQFPCLLLLAAFLPKFRHNCSLLVAKLSSWAVFNAELQSEQLAPSTIWRAAFWTLSMSRLSLWVRPV